MRQKLVATYRIIKMRSLDGAAGVPDRAVLAIRAQAEAGLEDFGDPWIFEHLDALIPALNREAALSPAGVQVAEGMLTRALVNRLRFVDLVKRNPEINNEKVSVAAVVVGLPRTGSTMLHRILASSPGMTGVRWYEAQNYAPFPGEARGDPEPRRAAAREILDYMLTAIPELMSIHPMDIDQPDEELIILGQLFSSTMIEGTYHVPSYARWLTEHDRIRPYRDLKQILKALQWQDPSRAGSRWVLKTPGHLMALDAIAEVFPEATVVMTHRDPAETVPSYCSMEASLYSMVSDSITPAAIGAFWSGRLAELLGMFMQARERSTAGRFVDVRYADLTSRPIEEASRVLAAAGVAVTPEIRAGMDTWIEANRREHRAPHRYSAADFGLTEDEIRRRFADYRAKFIDVA
jgi:hypothetical protein